MQPKGETFREENQDVSRYSQYKDYSRQ